MEVPSTQRGPGSGSLLRGWGGPALLVAFLVTIGGFVALRDQYRAAPSASAPSVSDPAPVSPSTTAPDPPAAALRGEIALPNGMGSGVAYAQTATAVFRIDLATGSFTRTPTPELTEFSSFVAGPGWVVSKSVDSRDGVIIRTGKPAESLPVGLQPPGRLAPAPGGTLWFQPEDPTDGSKTVRRLDIEGNQVGNDRIDLTDPHYILGNDGADYLLWSTTGGAYQVRPAGARRLTKGSLLAVSRHRLLVWNCPAQGRCGAAEVDRSTGARVELRRASRTIRQLFQTDRDSLCVCGDVSPDGRYAAIWHQDLGDAYRLRVIDLRTGESSALPGAMTDMNGNTQMAWTKNSRWLLAVTDHRLRAYDSRTGSVETLTLTDDEILHLAMRGAPGN